MRLALHIVALGLAAALSFGSALAKDISGDARAALLETVARFDAAMSEGDFGTVVAMVPDKVMGVMAEDLNVTPDELTILVADQMTTVLQQVKILDFRMETDRIVFEETENGIPFTFLPTRTVIEVQDAKVETKSSTLALRDGEEWRLIRIDDPDQLKILRKVYPGFAKVEFPESSMKLVE